jgi:glucose/mannose transport system substrate-binding protein
MTGTAWASATVGLVAWALLLPACGGGAGSSANSPVEILDWWTAGGEKEAIGDLLQLFEQQYPTETVQPTAIEGSAAARALIQTRMIGGDPPDTFQANGGWDLLAWVLYNNVDAYASKMDPVNAQEEGWADAMPQAVLDTVSFQGACYGVPLDIHRINTLFFNKTLFDRFESTPPDTLDDVFSAAAALQASGIAAPIALGTKDGTLPLVFFENLLVSRAGAAYYRSFMLGQGEPLAPEIATAVDDLATLLTYANTNSAQLTWSQAADRVLTEDAAMTIMGDWDKGYMMSRDEVVNLDFRALPTPGTAGTFVFTTDTFGLPKGALNRAGTIDMLTIFGSKGGQDTFNPVKGSISPRSDTDITVYDDMGKQTIAEFRQASQNGTVVAATAILAPPAFMSEINTALLQFVVDGNKSTVMHTIANYYDILRDNPLRY